MLTGWPKLRCTGVSLVAQACSETCVA